MGDEEEEDEEEQKKQRKERGRGNSRRNNQSSPPPPNPNREHSNPVLLAGPEVHNSNVEDHHQYRSQQVEPISFRANRVEGRNTIGIN